jgi:ribosomal protein L40E
MMYRENFVAVIKCNGSILREGSGGVVRLPFGSNYSILLKNKHARKASVSIEVDGEDVLNGNTLIVGPNESTEIKGFMRDMSNTNRFKFINKTKQIQEHRGDRVDDGLVRISYRFEKPTELPIWNSFTYTDGCPSMHVSDSSAHWSYSNSNTTKCSSPVSAFYSAPLSDEGITVKGERTRQNYEYGYIGLLEEAAHVIVLHLKGFTERKRVVKAPITVKTKLVCETCGLRSKSSAKFCRRCGTYLD